MSTGEQVQRLLSGIGVAALTVMVSAPAWSQSALGEQNAVSPQTEGTGATNPAKPEPARTTGACNPPFDFSGCKAIAPDSILDGTAEIPAGPFLTRSLVGQDRYIVYRLDTGEPDGNGEGKCNPPFDFTGCPSKTVQDALRDAVALEPAFTMELLNGIRLGAMPVPDL